MYRSFVRIVLVCSCIAFTPLPALAQQNGVGGGVLAGLTSSTLSGPKITTAQQLAGVSAGGFLTTALTDMVSLEMDGLFTQRGAKAVDGRDQGKLRINYFDIPFLLRVGTNGVNGAPRFYAKAGPTISLRMSASASFNDTVDTSVKSENISGMDIGFTLGGGAVISNIVLDVRATFGLRTADAVAPIDEVKNRSIAFMAGFRFK